MTDLIATHPLLTIVLVLFIEELGVPTIIPGDLMMLLAGIQVAEGRASIWGVLLLEELATLAGASLLFALSRRVGRPLLLKYGRYVGLSPERFVRVEGRVGRHPGAAMLLGRLLPGLRIISVAAAGALAIPAAQFFPALAVGAFLYLLTYTLLGVVFGRAALRALARTAIPLSAFVSLGTLVMLTLLLREFRRSEGGVRALRGSVAAFVLGGLLSGVFALLAANTALALTRLGARSVGRTFPSVLGGTNGALDLLVGRPVFLVAALAVGAAYGALKLYRLPAPVSIVFAGVVPLVFTLLLIEPLADPGVEVPTGEARVLVVTTVIRWVTFASALTLLSRPAGSVADAEIVAAPGG